MSQGTARSGLPQVLLKQLSHPLKLRFALVAAIIVAWHAFFFSALGEQVAATTDRIARERKRVATAREVDRLKNALAPYHEVAGSDDLSELIGEVMDRLRSSPLRLVDLKPQKAKELGPLLALGLKLRLEGGYNDIDEFLHWIEAQKRALRIDSIGLAPGTKEPGQLSADLTLVALADRAAATAKDKVGPQPAAKAQAQPGSKAQAQPGPPAAKARARPGPATKAQAHSGKPR
jgi:Tfp pilus assembly protein PilO